MKEKVSSEPSEEEKDSVQVKRQQSLLQKYDIPVEHLDFKYIQGCTNPKEVERILRILRSGEEGYFPDLEKCVTNRLELLNPKSRILRVETPIVRSEYLGNQELDELKKTFLDWVDEIEEANEKDSRFRMGDSHSSIFLDEIVSHDSGVQAEVPIRQVKPGTSKSINKSEAQKDKNKPTTSTTEMEEPGFIRPANPNRIKSWDYDKWDKFDVDAELTKLDIEHMQGEECDKSIDETKLRKEQELVEKLMRNEPVPSYLRQSQSHLHRQPKPKNREIKSKSIFSKTSTPSAKLTTMTSSMSKINPEILDGIPDLEDDPQNQNHRGPDSLESPTASTSSQQYLTTCASSSSVLLDPRNSDPNERGHSSKLQSFLSSASNPLKQHHQQEQQWRDPSRKSFIEELPSDEPKKKSSNNNGSKNNAVTIIETNPKAEEKPKRRFKIQIEDLHIS